MKHVKIETIDDLKKVADRKWRAFFICLCSPLISSKDIRWGGRKFHVVHGIDGTYETMTTAELEKSNIGDSIRLGGFYLEGGVAPW